MKEIVFDSATVTPKYTKNCVVCGEDIVGKRIDAKYCGNICGNKGRNRSYRKRNPERVKSNRERQLDKTEKRMLSRVKCRARRSGVPFNLCELDIVIPDVCPVLGISLNLRNRGSGFHADSPSIDRIVPSGGYLKGNVRVISSRANLLKSDATIEELEMVLYDLKKLRK